MIKFHRATKSCSFSLTSPKSLWQMKPNIEQPDQVEAAKAKGHCVALEPAQQPQEHLYVGVFKAT